MSITGDNDIPINKRGSGVKRLILLNFFRAEAERRLAENIETGIIYAIEEPETSQHFENQKKLIDALITLSQIANTQVVLTTHSGIIVKKLSFDNLRLVLNDQDGNKYVSSLQPNILVYPSLNEVNYTAFGEITEEYHDELYGCIMENDWLHDYENGKPQIPYIRLFEDGRTRSETRTVTKYIRDKMHHPENTYNNRYTYQMLADSINDMRTYIRRRMQEIV